jgi:methionyl-tRNA synthetase
MKEGYAMSAVKRKILVTSALPYANGDIHIGHLVEYIQTDIWVRFMKMMGHECHYMCADDTHGTPVMVSARKQGITPEELVERMNVEHRRDFADFHIEFDNYYSTNSPENREFVEYIFLQMKEKGHIEERRIDQLYCEKDAMFLPDRFVRGTCPRCGAEDQYGDSCEVCSSTYSPTDLKDAVCSVCRTAPQLKSTVHYFFKLGDFSEALREWTGGDHVQPEVRRKLDEWFSQGLKDWDITRDAPYFGFKIPCTDDKYFYVWLDAPVGYMASTKNWCEKTGRSFDEFWKNGSSEIYHFIGKDIMYFHCLFWPATLMASGFKTPDRIHIHGFLTVNGEKMSKSRGTFINARTYLKYLDPQYLRYYYASKLGSSTSDIDLSLDDFVSRINSEVVGKIANLGSRVAPMLSKKLDGKTGSIPEEARLLVAAVKASAADIAAAYESREFSKAVREICRLADEANRFVEQQAPWSTIKTDPEKTRGTITAVLEVFRLLTLYLKPVLPKLAADVEEFLRIGPMSWSDIAGSIENHQMGEFRHLIQRAEMEKVSAMVEESRIEREGTPVPASAEPVPVFEPLAPECTIEDFSKLDLRIGKILSAEAVEGADRLLRLVVDIGMKQVSLFAGIREAYSPESLPGRLVVVAANLKPRKMKFGTSEGMVLAAGPGGKEVFLLAPDEGSTPGQRVH